MQKINPSNKNGKITKLFIKEHDRYLIDEIQILFPGEYVEVYMVEEFTRDYSELFCYKDMYIQHLPAVLVCDSENELQVLETYRNFDG